MIEWIYDMDKNILLLIQDYVRDDMLTPVMKFITTLGNAGFIWIVLAILLCIIKKYRRTGITCFYALGLSLVINNLFLKHFIARSRPFDVIGELVPLIPKPTDFSFPSGHTACSFAAGFLLFRKLPKKYGIPVLLLAVLISFSRLYVGVHYPSDVIAGTVSGICISYLAEIAVNFLEKCVAEHHKKQQIERGKEA